MDDDRTTDAWRTRSCILMIFTGRYERFAWKVVCILIHSLLRAPRVVAVEDHDGTGKCERLRLQEAAANNRRGYWSGGSGHRIIQSAGQGSKVRRSYGTVRVCRHKDGIRCCGRGGPASVGFPSGIPGDKVSSFCARRGPAGFSWEWQCVRTRRTALAEAVTKYWKQRNGNHQCVFSRGRATWSF